MSELIRGKEALIALANGEEVEYYKHEWMNVNRLSVRDLTSSDNMYKFRIKPRTTTLDGIEIPKPMSIGWGDPNRNRVEIGFNSEAEAEEFFNKFRGFV